MRIGKYFINNLFSTMCNAVSNDAPKDVWDISCEHKYEGVECDVSAAMRYAEKSCSLRK
jgi:hypothetical protein